MSSAIALWPSSLLKNKAVTFKLNSTNEAEALLSLKKLQNVCEDLALSQTTAFRWVSSFKERLKNYRNWKKNKTVLVDQ